MSKLGKKINPRLMKAAVYGAHDGLITTFAIMAGVVGANLSSSVVIILGLANLIADGISMGFGDFIGERSERRLRATNDRTRIEGRTWETGLVTFTAFVIAGFSPILPFILNRAFLLNLNEILISVIATGSILFLIGSARTFLTGGTWWKNGLELLTIGMLAAGVAYLLGDVARSYIPMEIVEPLSP